MILASRIGNAGPACFVIACADAAELRLRDSISQSADHPARAAIGGVSRHKQRACRIPPTASAGDAKPSPASITRLDVAPQREPDVLAGQPHRPSGNDERVFDICQARRLQDQICTSLRGGDPSASAIETSARASAGASLMPSPSIATSCPALC